MESSDRRRRRGVRPSVQFYPSVEEAFQVKAGFPLGPNTLYACYVGSKSHNTYVPSNDPESFDDIDIMAVVLPPRSKVLGLDPWKETEQIQIEEWDVVVHSASKYIGLLMKGNPSLLATLWVRPDDQLHLDNRFRTVLSSRDVFSTRNAITVFEHYARSQLHKMSSHENAYQGYMGEKRKQLVDKYGYDLKNAAHTIRLLAMGIEFLSTGQLKVFRDEDAETIRSIKRGEWPLAKVLTYADVLFAEIQRAGQNSSLPLEPDKAIAERLLLDLYRAPW